MGMERAVPQSGRCTLGHSGMLMVGSPTEMALREVRNDLKELRQRAERLELEVVASLLRMAILDLDTALQDDGAASELDS